MPNALAFAALIVWPIVTLVLFRRLPPGRAFVASMLIAYLFLPPPPAGVDPPLMLPLTKETIPSLAAFLVFLLVVRDWRSLIPEGTVVRVLMVLFVTLPVATVLNNPEPVHFDGFGLPGLRLRESLGMMINQTILLMPFLMARALLSRPEDLRDLMVAFVIAGLVYSFPMLLEVRLSPQINTWVYGYFQHDFTQMMRGDGFRPIVFLYHGLWVAFLTMTAILAAAAVARTGDGRGAVFYAGAAVWLLIVLVLSKSLASLLYALAALPVVFFLGPRMQLRVAVLLAVLAVSYPVARGLDLVPTDRLVAMAERAGPARAQSLDFRFDNETVLLERAAEKPVFGWGSWGRNQIWDGTGRLLTVTDGRWIILVGAGGWLMLLAEFGLLTLPIFALWWHSRHRDNAVPVHAATAAVILAINMVDLLPNATLTPLTWLFAGALLGLAERVRAMAPQRTLTEPAFRTVL
jgi:hypothetical protein